MKEKLKEVDPSNNFFKVRAIGGRKLINKKTHYKVFWDGYPDHTATWEPYQNLKFCLPLIKSFNSLHKEQNIFESPDHSNTDLETESSRIKINDNSHLFQIHRAGGFDFGDQLSSVLAMRGGKGVQAEFLVEWKQKQGFRPLNSIVSYDQIRQFGKDELLLYLKDNMIFE